jgi:hypothetical protein
LPKLIVRSETTKTTNNNISNIMSTVLANTATSRSAEKAVTDIHYTICPVFAASNVALELGWIEEELKKVDARLNYLFLKPFSAALQS